MSAFARTIFPALAGLLTANGAVWAQSGARSGHRRHLARPGLAARSRAQQRLLGATDGQYRKCASREHLTIIGTKYMPRLETAYGKEWADRADGSRLRPNAQVTVCGEPGFGSGGWPFVQTRSCRSCANTGLVNLIESMKIDCHIP